MRTATWLALPALVLTARASPPLAVAVMALLTATIGIGHGATDDRVLLDLWPSVPGGRGAIAAVYGAIALSVFAVARRNPKATRAALEGLGWFHFGAGDVAFAKACGSKDTSALAALVRGSYTRIGPGAWRSPECAGALAYAVLLAGRRRYADALDVALPAIAVAVAPPAFGAAAYFAAWHAPRHVALLLRADRRGGHTLERLRRFAGASASNSIVSLLAGGAGLALAKPEERGDMAVAAIFAITVPHQITISLDARYRKPSL